MIEEDNRIGNFINGEFLSYAEQNNVDLNYNEFCFIAESDDGEIVGVITGRAYYNEVHIGDLIHFFFAPFFNFIGSSKPSFN